MDKYTVISLDVWAGDEEGTFEKNNFFKCGEIELKEDATDTDILNELIESGFIKEGVTLDTVYFADHGCDGSYIELIERETNYPLYDLQRI